MIFESITYWQAGEFVVCIFAGIFFSKDEAEGFGRMPVRLVREYDRLVFYSRDLDLELDSAHDNNVCLFKIRKESRDKLKTEDTKDWWEMAMVGLRDFEPVNMKISDYSKCHSLDVFKRLSFGVREITDIHRIVACASRTASSAE